MLACISIMEMDMCHDEIVVATSNTGDKLKIKLSVNQKSENEILFESGLCNYPAESHSL